MNRRRSPFLQWLFSFALVAATIVPIGSPLTLAGEPEEKAVFRAGVAAVDVTPAKLPVISSGSFLSRTGNVIHDPLYARGLALDDGKTRVVFVVVDTLFVSRDLCEEVKERASKKTGVSTDCIMISATHSHSAGSLLGCLGTEADEDYVCQVRPQLVECIEEAVANLQPAEIGWSSAVDAEDTHCRVFIRRPDCIGIDPFGERTIRVMMHPGYENPEYIGPSAPVDNELSILAVRTAEGQPLGVLANYSMHYFGAAAVSADYFGDFVRLLSEQIAAEDDSFVAMISNGTSADLHWMDYSKPRKEIQRLEYAKSVVATAMQAYETIAYHDWVPLGVVERTIELNRRVPDEARWEWAQKLLKEMDGRVPQNRPEVYAREAKYLREEPVRKLTLQAIAIGDLGIAAIPNEVYSITGLKLKRQSPMACQFNIELANGAEGYIPPPEELALGGYNAWPARTAGLQVDAETIITDTLLSMFETLSDRKRNTLDLSSAPYAQKMLERKPLAYWRMGEMEGTLAKDISGAGNHGLLETGYLFFLDGPDREDLRCGDQPSRAIQFVGGRMKATIDALPDDYAVEMYFWNGLPNDNRPVTGYLFSRGPDGVDNCPGDHLCIAGNASGEENRGRLLFYNGDQSQEQLIGGPVIEPKTWNHLRLVRQGDTVRVYLNFADSPVLSGNIRVTRPSGSVEVFIGGRSDNFANLEGRVADAAVFSIPPR